MLGIKTRKQMLKAYEPQADYGFLGPDSVSWKVWSHPTSYVLGFARAVTIEHFDPNLAAAVIQSGGVKYRPSTRYGRTLRYFAMQLFGGAEVTAKAADVLVKVHSKAVGHDPVTGGTYDANSADSQLWIHVTAWHSILKCYEMFGPGKLTEAEENQFWAECREIAKLQTINPDEVPATRAEVHAYFEAWRPRLAASEGAQDMIHFIMPLSVALPPSMPAWQKKALAPVMWTMSKGVISTYPKHMRDMANLQQGPLLDAYALVGNKALHKLFERSMNIRLWMFSMLAPAAVDVAAPAILGITPVSDRIWEVREAQAHFGFDVPGEAHHDIRAKQRDRVFNKGLKPSDAGLEESQAHIGSMDVHNPEKLGA
ncbi:oxygenase MpaB family protein [Nocardioides sp.]|uniref:oxygenase MpaB family protein n=1 Tax=Nocardioides sp. TaxID=35761 RepID=UPI002C1CE5DD|nr:oxygenase MpaB family protein [Nocardioides sp.]HSX68435.1 oxygenase MpaB family protein [Nocardioides sp.]